MRRIFLLSAFCLIHLMFFSSVIIVSKNSKVSSITQAIKLAGSFDTILIKQGIYNENAIIIDKPLTIIGEYYPTIDGLSKSEIFSIKSSFVKIIGLKIQNTGFGYTQDRAAIKLIKVKHCEIANNIIYNSFFGIYLFQSDSSLVFNNKITGIPKNESNTGNGIHLFKSSAIVLKNNEIYKHRDGIYLEFVTNSKIIQNKSQNQIRYGLHFMFSNDCEYLKNEFSNNNAGVAVMYSRNINMHENIFSDNWSVVSTGLLLKEIKDSKIEKNIFIQNTTAIYAEGCIRISFLKNNFLRNGWAIKILGSSDDNTFLYNNFISNTFEVVTNTSINNNIFNKNFWSNYSGYDLNKDGYGDIPHRPVKLFTFIIENTPPTIILLRSLFIDLLEIAEKITPVLTPETLLDTQPLMHQYHD